MLDRRALLARCGGGIGMFALSSLLQQEGLLANEASLPSLNPLAPKPAHFAAKAKAVIWIFVNGGHSQVDTWDYKPELIKRDGQELPGFDRSTGFFINDVGPLMKSPFEFKQHGQCGKHVSSIFPNLSKHVDKMAFIHSLWSESNNHSPALFMMNTACRGWAIRRSARGSPMAWDPRTRTCRVRRDVGSQRSRPAQGSLAQLDLRLSPRRVSRGRGSSRPARRSTT